MSNKQFSLYIHFPWCIQKCYYCDFNSRVTKNIPEELYVAKILAEFTASLELLSAYNKTELVSIFFGGGTPSLLAASSIAKILNQINAKFNFSKKLEISLEVNPKSIEYDNMANYKAAGISRISLGVQSFDDKALQLLGRIHRATDVVDSIKKIITAKFTSFNLDLMYGLPCQTLNAAKADLQTAITFNPQHISWYQLTIEPNTLFAKKTPDLPSEDLSWEIFQQGIDLLSKHNYLRYEISAFAKINYTSRHNMHYWQYGDYLGLGPGAHSKFTKFCPRSELNVNINNLEVLRFAQPNNPKVYFANIDKMINYPNEQMQITNIIGKELVFEFMLNNLRLTQGFTLEDLQSKTGYSIEDLKIPLFKAQAKGLLTITNKLIQPTELGFRFLNDLQQLFLA